MKCNKDEANVLVKKSNRLMVQDTGVAEVGDEVMVCECNNESTVMVYNRELM